jgi:hypothetical protein
MKKTHFIELFLTLQEFNAIALQSILIQQGLLHRFCFNPKYNQTSCYFDSKSFKHY